MEEFDQISTIPQITPVKYKRKGHLTGQAPMKQKISPPP